MNTTDLFLKALRVEPKKECIPLIIDILSISYKDLWNIDLGKLESPSDYCIEHVIETAHAILENGHFEKKQIEATSILLANLWFQLNEFPGGIHEEINIRSGEFLALAASLTKKIYYPEERPFNFDSVSILVASDNWRSRYLGALIAHDFFPAESHELLQNLSQDPYQDDQGYYLVRNAAGFRD
jgi:hypothetical protein